MAFDGARLADGFGRRFRYLRLSVTEVCNFRCTYCLPQGWKRDGPLSFLTVEEIGRLARAFSTMGVAKVRLTGGEPTVRKDFVDIVETVANTPGVDKVAVTTNGWNLSRFVDDWRTAGLTHLNISLDALDAEAFHRITGKDRFREVMAGLDAALALPFQAVKVNAVLLRESAEVGFADWAEFVRHRPLSVRFIELMRTADNANYFTDHHVGGGVLRAWLAREGWSPVVRTADGGPAQEYRHPDFLGSIGLIAPYAPGFCDSCNRLRVTARGKLRLCLFGEGGVELRPLLGHDDNVEELAHCIAAALSGKPRAHRLASGDPGDLGNLSQLGG